MTFVQGHRAKAAAELCPFRVQVMGHKTGLPSIPAHSRLRNTAVRVSSWSSVLAGPPWEFVGTSGFCDLRGFVLTLTRRTV